MPKIINPLLRVSVLTDIPSQPLERQPRSHVDEQSVSGQNLPLDLPHPERSSIFLRRPGDIYPRDFRAFIRIRWVEELSDLELLNILAQLSHIL